LRTCDVVTQRLRGRGGGGGGGLRLAKDDGNVDRTVKQG
jgi:hypothetical protein